MEKAFSIEARHYVIQQWRQKFSGGYWADDIDERSVYYNCSDGKHSMKSLRKKYPNKGKFRLILRTDKVVAEEEDL